MKITVKVGTSTLTHATGKLDSLRDKAVPFSVAIGDIDFFKKCNDQYGHERGDSVLRQFAKLLKDNTREEDMIARYGGEEFVVLLMGDTSEKDALSVGNKLRQLVEDTAFEDFAPGQITVSGGVGIVNPDDDYTQLFTRADQALYEAKRQGRNRVCLYKKPEASV